MQTDIDSRPTRADTSALPANVGASCEIHLNIPDSIQSASSVASILRLTELLLVFRSLTPAGKVSQKWRSSYIEFLKQFAGQPTSDPISEVVRQAAIQELAAYTISDLYAIRAELRAASPLFEAWIIFATGGHGWLPLIRISRGSYEFAFQAAGLLAIIGLQDYSLLKDSVQWTCSVIRDLLGRAATARSVVSSESAEIKLTPALVRSLSHYDEVELFKEETSDKITYRIRLSRRTERAKPAWE